MTLPVRDQVKYWGLAALVFLIALYAMGDVLMPFIVGGAIAYFLDPIADRLQRMGLSRVAATALITICFVIIACIIVLAGIPMLVKQANELIKAAPAIVQNLQNFVTERFPDLDLRTGFVGERLKEFGAYVESQGGTLAKGVLSSAMSVISAVVFIVVVPVVAFYLLLDWDKMVATIDGMIPRDHVATTRRLAREIDQVLAGFLRGQLTVCLILGAYYSTALMLAGLQFGLVVGAIAGAVTFIPYIGAIVGGVLAIGLALFQFWGEWVWVGAVVAIFVLGQFIEGNILTPKLVGNSVGLHPVWLLFALSAFGALFGFVGMLVAVPVAAALGVLARFVLEQYTHSRLYQGHQPSGDPR